MQINNGQCWQSNETFGRLGAKTPGLEPLLHPNSLSSSKVNSTSNQLEHLGCLFYGPIALGVGLRKRHHHI